MPSLPNISEAEWTVMKTVWARAPRTAQEIIDAVAPREGWHPKTVKTLLNRLVKKGALGYEKQGRAYLYHPKVAETDCVTEASHSFLERVFGGSLRPMLAHFVEHEQLSGAEIRELKALLKKK
jgi:BlaI family transcriptional regulator, penicillinase repressor